MDLCSHSRFQFSSGVDCTMDAFVAYSETASKAPVILDCLFGI